MGQTAGFAAGSWIVRQAASYRRNKRQCSVSRHQTSSHSKPTCDILRQVTQLNQTCTSPPEEAQITEFNNKNSGQA
ncbi:MAG: hypothetical protein ACSLFC_06100, partial [Desulfuromonadales bacterium]